LARRNSYNGKYKLSKEQFLSAKYFALRYNEWRMEYDALHDTARAITYSDMPKGSLLTESPVEEAAIRCEGVLRKIKLIEQTASEAGGDLHQYLLKAVTNEGITYNALRTLNEIPCSHNTYYKIRRRFYYLLAQKI